MIINYFFGGVNYASKTLEIHTAALIKYKVEL